MELDVAPGSQRKPSWVEDSGLGLEEVPKTPKNMAASHFLNLPTLAARQLLWFQEIWSPQTSQTELLSSRLLTYLGALSSSYKVSHGKTHAEKHDERVKTTKTLFTDRSW